MPKTFLTYLLFVFTTVNLNAQEINFGDFFNYPITVSELNSATDLDFGTIVSSSGFNSIGLANAKVITIEGIRYLDVFVTITAEDEMLLDGNTACIGDPSCSIPFTLQAAFANRGSDNIGDARIINITANSATAQFPIRSRTTRPPAPPPTPVFEGFDFSGLMDTAFLYIYGSINVGNISAGTYQSTINITISYD